MDFSSLDLKFFYDLVKMFYDLVFTSFKRKKEQQKKDIQEAEALLEKVTLLPVIIENFINSNQPYYVTKEITTHQQRPAEQCWSARSAMIPITTHHTVGEWVYPNKKIDITSSPEYISAKNALEKLAQLCFDSFKKAGFVERVDNIKDCLTEIEKCVQIRKHSY